MSWTIHDAMAKIKYEEEKSSRIIAADTLQSCTENKFKHSFHFVPLALSVKCVCCAVCFEEEKKTIEE